MSKRSDHGSSVLLGRHVGSQSELDLHRGRGIQAGGMGSIRKEDSTSKGQM